MDMREWLMIMMMVIWKISINDVNISLNKKWYKSFMIELIKIKSDASSKVGPQ